MANNSATSSSQNILHGVLLHLAEKPLDMNKNAEELTSWCIALLSVYSHDFRHQYSQFYPLLIFIRSETNYDFNYLTENLNSITHLLETSPQLFKSNKHISDFERAVRSILKLQDHINLEIARINDFRSLYEQHQVIAQSLEASLANHHTVQEQFQQSQDEVSRLSEQTATLSADVETARKQMDTSQSTLISVLSIFSAIVIAFFGGFSFMGNAIASIENAPLLKTLTLCLVCGLVLFDAVFLLLYLVAKLVNKSIYARCESENCTCKNDKGKSPKCGPFKRLRKRLPFVFYFNILVLVLLFLTAALQAICLLFH
ncbi:MAG: hypothetical protein IJF65_00730 [Clostridia bacterium]|nr:hypothetical protein [Clostridia bacterium]